MESYLENGHPDTPITDLVNFAYSPRLRSMLEKPLEVVLVAPISVALLEPSIQEISNAIAAPSTRLTSPRSPEPATMRGRRTSSVRNSLTSSTARTLSMGVHAELRLLIHHERNRNPAPISPFQYISVSKLSCFCCRSIFGAYTHATGRVLSLRGSHSKLYFPWWPATAEFGEYVGTTPRARRLMRLYSKHLIALQEQHRRRSDSTVASGETNDAGGSQTVG